MASLNSPAPSRKLGWFLGAAGLVVAALVVRSQLSPAHTKHRVKLASLEATPTATGTLFNTTTSNEGVAAREAPPPRLPSSALPRNIDPVAYLNERFPNQATPVITLVPQFTEADKERAAREMFPEYRRTQEEVEAERKRLGLTAQE
jgi:hypothetical protein